MSFEACAQIVEKGDPDRFLAVMAAPPALRRVLFPIYAFNVEVSRAPWVTEEPMIAEMRLQWWRDALEEIATNAIVRRHDVTDMLAQVLDPQAARLLDGLVAARRWDVYKDAFEDDQHFKDYINATAGDLLWTATRLSASVTDTPATGHDADTLEANVKKYGRAVGVANWLRAIPDLEARGRIPLLAGNAEAVRMTALSALHDLDGAAWFMCKEGMVDETVAAALRVGWRAKATLKKAALDPMRVADGRLDESPLMRRTSLLWCTLRGAF